MEAANYNCIICAKEFDLDELHSITASAKINSTRFKICQGCLDKSDPANDYSQARKIVDSYFKCSEAKYYFSEAQEILEKK